MNKKKVLLEHRVQDNILFPFLIRLMEICHLKISTLINKYHCLGNKMNKLSIRIYKANFKSLKMVKTNAIRVKKENQEIKRTLV